MELKVWVDGVQRVVCGLAERTTCQEVIYALAHATQRTGRFVLVEKWRKSERSLSPNDRPLELLLKWGEYSNDVQFVLKCLEDTTTTTMTAPPVQQQPQRPASAMQQRIVQQPFNKSSKSAVLLSNGGNGRRSMNNSTDEQKSGIAAEHHRHTILLNGEHSNTNNHNGTTPASLNTMMTSVGGVLKPYYVDTSSPHPESGTLIRPTSTMGVQQVQQPTTEASLKSTSSAGGRQQLAAAASGGGSLSTTSQQYFITTTNAPLLQRATTTNGNAMSSTSSNDKKPTGGILTVLSHSTHESGGIGLTTNSQILAQQPAFSTGSNSNTNNVSSTSFDSSGTTLYLESSYTSSGGAYQTNSNQQSASGPAASMMNKSSGGTTMTDLSQTSFCNSSISSNTSVFSGGSSATGQPNTTRTSGMSRPPPPSYDAYVNKRRDQIMMANRSGQPSPMFGHNSGSASSAIASGSVAIATSNALLMNRSRTPVMPSEHQHQQQQQQQTRYGGYQTGPGQQPMTREQLIRLIETQQFQIQTQFQTMRVYETEITHREHPERHSQQNQSRSQTPIAEHLRRELQQLEVERVHVKQKAEELRRQNLDSQLTTLRQSLADTLLESAKLEEKLKSIDAQMLINEEKIRAISNEIERERSEVFNLSASSSSLSISSSNSNLAGMNEIQNLASNEAFESRLHDLDELLQSKRKQLENIQQQCAMDSELSQLKISHSRSRSFEVGQQKSPGSVENVSGVWV